MSKTGVCGCGTTVTIGKSECLFQCHCCSAVSVFLCHVLGDPKDPMHMRCRQCKTTYSMYNCPKCDAFAVIKGFESGKMYNCLCGFQATMLACNRCTALLCLPTRASYELAPIKCKKCENTFKYRLCPACKYCNYLRPEQSPNEPPLCFNEDCQLAKQMPLQRVEKEPAKIDIQQPKQKMALEVQNNPYEQMLPSQKKESEQCNICMSKEKCMINTTCYHLSVCEQCSRDLQGRCPICRAIGTYKMVFRS